jgi:3,4-dihydroxy 2-butanone 4-phosphate synthase/GTP cyclohydrolase II
LGVGLADRMRLVREVGYSKDAGHPTTTWRSGTEKMPSIRRVARAGLPTAHGDFEMFVYEAPDGKEHVALVTGFEPGNLKRDEPVLVRLHSECLTGDVFGSRRCDCGGQLEESMRLLREQGLGVLLYLRQEGRGVGLANKISAYALQDEGLDTVQANLALGLPEDARDYGVAAEILLDLGVHRAAVLTNNPAKIEGLRRYGVEVVERLPVQVEPNPLNISYLQTKQEKLGHLFPSSVLPDEGRAGGSADEAS